MLTIVMFSLLLAATSLSNMAKSRTNAFVDGTSTFYVAEAGLNKRAAEINKKLTSYSPIVGPMGAGEKVKDCVGVGIPAGGSGESPRSGNNDLECVNYRFLSSNNTDPISQSGGNIALDSGGKNYNNYVAYTVVTETKPQPRQIPPGEDYAGLNAIEYKYKVSAMGKKPLALPQVSTMPVYTDAQIAAKNRQTKEETPEAGDEALIAAFDSIKAQADAARKAATTAADDSSNNTELSMTFTYRVIPLFQFGIFYNGDLELNSTSDMQINGWVHSNANMYLQPAGLTGVTATTTFASKVSAVGSVYNRVDAWPVGLVDRPGITRLLKIGTTDTYNQLPDYVASVEEPLSATQISAIPEQQLKDGVTALKTPSPGFTRKRNYATNEVGEYFGKADIRLEMVPDRDVTSKVNTPWTRDKARIPFNFTAITTSGTGTCTTTAPTAGSDPAATYVDPSRDNLSALRCNVFNKGQLQSLRQPVMVLTNINQNRSNSASTAAQFKTQESETLGGPIPSELPTPPTLSSAANTTDTKKKIIRALQVAIASTPKPIQMNRLNEAFKGGTGVYSANTNDESLATFSNTFSNLINNITLSSTDRDNLLKATPNQIAALMEAWFLPAPIQRIERQTPDTADNTNRRSSGFYDGRERRWITMLQTNIASLSVWNRDAVYVQADSETLTLPYSPAAGAVAVTFGGGIGTTNNTAGLAFDRISNFTTANGSEIYPEDSLQYLGLGGSDKTEGGLIFHATVNDDLDGSGGALVAANDITVNTGDTSQRILKKNSDNTNAVDASGNPIVIDYYRKYPNQTASQQSPFGFAVNGGNYLPNAMMLSSDQSIYIQGNFNNNSDSTNLPENTPNIPDPDRVPAAVVADTITVLSNQCVANNSNPNPLLVPSSQLTCGVPPLINGGIQYYNGVSSAIAVNAAFLSNTQVSNGNKGSGRYNTSLDKSYSGGVNNYIRLLEDWNSNSNPFALNYHGSLISLNEPIEYGGLYREGGIDPTDPIGTSYYNIPFRNFNYDPNFNDALKLPPLTPKASYFLQNSFNRKYSL